MTTPNTEDITKTRRQKIALTRWKDSDYKGTLNLTMRFGKTRCARLAIEHFIRETPNDCKTIILVPNVVTKRNMQAECGHLQNVSIITAAEITRTDVDHSTVYKDYSFLIIDEIQKFISTTTKVNQSLETIIPLFKRVLALSGSTFTPSDSTYLSKIGIPICDKISEAEAIANKWVANYVEYNLAIELEDHIKSAYSTASEYIASTLDMFNKSATRLNDAFKNPTMFKTDFDVVLACFLGKKVPNSDKFTTPSLIRDVLAFTMGWTPDLDMSIDYNITRDRHWNPVNIYERAKTFKKVVKSRNDLLINNRAKLQAVIDIIETNSVPTICFNESTEMADLEQDYFNKDGIVYHSNIESRCMTNPITGELYRKVNGDPKVFGKKGLLNLTIDGVRNGIYKYIFTAKALNEGINIENISQVIITAGDMNPKTQEQRSARGKTININDFEKSCIVINLYIDDFVYNDRSVISRDKQKLIQRQSNTSNVHWVHSVEDIFRYDNSK